jgi:hypothetical protein
VVTLRTTRFNTEPRRAMYAQRNIEIRWRAKAMCYILWVSVALVIKHATRMRRIILSFWLLYLYHIFPHYLINVTIFGSGELFNIKLAFWFSLQLLSETFLILKRIRRHTAINVHMSSCKVPVILVRFYSNLTPLENFPKKKTSNIKYHENFSGGSRIVPCGWQTDMTKLKIPFRNFMNAPKNSTFCQQSAFMCFEMDLSTNSDYFHSLVDFITKSVFTARYELNT